jgi:hypothetical protein
MTGSAPTTTLVIAAAELSVADADAGVDADPVAETPLELLPELPQAAVNAARERAPTAARARRPARICLMTLLIVMISGDRWLAAS